MSETISPQNSSVPYSRFQAKAEMPKTSPTESLLQILHSQSGADQSALYFFSYPGMDQLVLNSTAGSNTSPVRYWRPQCADFETVTTLRQSKDPVNLMGEPVTGKNENCIALPVYGGDMAIGAIILCFVDAVDSGQINMLQHIVHGNRHLFFREWVEFIVADQTRPLSVLFQIAGTISSSLDLERVLLNVVEQATILFRIKMSSLHLLDPKRNELEMITAYGCSLEYLDLPNLPVEGSFLGSVVKQNRVMQLENVFDEPKYFHKELARHEGVSSLMSAPIKFRDQTLGVLNVYSTLPRQWQRSETELLQTFANHAAIAIQNVRVHEQFLSMEEQLHETAKRSILGELAAGLAHEIRNPLAVINMLIHSWKASPPEPDDFADDVDVVVQKISDLNNLVTELLHLSTSRPLERTPQNVEELIDRVFRLLRHRIKQQKINFKKNMEWEHRVLPIDRERLEQAILNLLLNALDMTPEGGEISVSVVDENERVAIVISDTGPGIPPEEVTHLFRMFKTTKKDGSGLGLAITKRIVDEHNGEILVKSNESGGASFYLLLPKEIV